MELRINIKPIVLIAGNKDAIMRRISHYTLNYGPMKATEEVAYNLQKYRKKVKVLDKPIKMTAKQLKERGFAKGKKKYITREVVTEAYWKAHVYLIPKQVLKFTKTRINQENHNFTLVKRQK